VVALPGERGLVDLQVGGFDDAQVGGHAVAGLHRHDVARDQLHRVDLVAPVVALDIGDGGGEAPQCLHGAHRPELGDEPHDGVGHQHHRHRDRFGDLADGQPGHHGGSEQGHDRAADLVEQDPPLGDLPPLPQRVAPDQPASPIDLAGAEPLVRVDPEPVDHLGRLQAVGALDGQLPVRFPSRASAPLPEGRSSQVTGHDPLIVGPEQRGRDLLARLA
jgi:hypothetical protein